MSATLTETITVKPIQSAGEAITAFNEPLDTSADVVERLIEIPQFSDKYAERQWAKEHMAGAFRVFAKMGYNDGAGGHISLRDPVHPDCFWINPYGIHYGMIKASDLVLVNEDGKPVTPTKYRVNKAGFMIHAALHKARPDVNAACHTHSKYGRAWSAFGRPIEMLNQDCCYFYNDLSVYEDFGGVVLGNEEGNAIARALGPSKMNIILQNHGILTCGRTVDQAAGFFIALEQACEAQLLAEAAAANGIQKKLIREKEAMFTKEAAGTPEVIYMQFQPEYDMVVKETNGEFLQ
ncbi:class II aldolase and Adducin domain-containing protein [Hypoxylon rubiginosum]|uniref:Class II aldolase and Adducin domain-containing protein n=1 Tax=Hypoxylon rubiginosum TaxID=110542 RepID=A0ACC0CW86_9PEZI|nr:class II aldolase and Adducin domain-containing protein [Hypoxylon rubiginosum]